jgi:nucleoside-diphosphate-sugar epimerase
MSAARSGMLRVLVTGATGVIGRRVVPRLVARGHRVTAVARTPDKRARVARWGADASDLDLLDADGARRAMAGHDVVLNLATHIPSSAFRMLLPWSWRENDRLRRDGSANLVDAALAAGVSRFIQESFAPAYEDGGERWIDEQWPLRPTAYNRTVLDAEASAARFTAAGREGVVLRFGGFYGPDAFLREMIGVVRRGWAPLPGPAGAYWSSVSHDDAASAAIVALDVPAGTYNVVDDEPLTRREWADALADAAGVRPPRLVPGWLTALGGGTLELLSRSQRITNEKLQRSSGWTPTLRTAREGLREAVRGLGGDAPGGATLTPARRGR